MAALDYAVLAEYARIDSAGLVTIVGGSFDRVEASDPSAVQQVFVALRLFTDADEERVPSEVRVRAPEQRYEILFSGVTARAPDASPVGGRFGFTAAIGLAAPLEQCVLTAKTTARSRAGVTDGRVQRRDLGRSRRT